MQIVHDAGTQRIGQRHRSVADPHLRAVRQQHIGRTLADQHRGARVRLVADHHRHALALGAERNLGRAHEALLAPRIRAQLALGHQEGGLRRVPLHDPLAAIVLPHIGIARGAATPQHHQHLVEQVAGRQGLRALQQPALGLVTHALDIGTARGGDDALDRHLRAGQRAGLVGADDGGRPQRLHRRDLLHDGLLARHALHAQCQHQRQDGRQALGHRRHRQRHAQQQHRHHVGDAADVRHPQHGRDHHHGNQQHGTPQHAADRAHLLLQRRHLVGRDREQVGDATHLGLHAGGGDDGPAVALHHRRALEHHVETIGQVRGGCQQLGVLENSLAFARERGLLDQQRVRLHQTGIGRHPVALGQQQHVARHEVGAADGAGDAVAQHRGIGHCQARQRGGSALGACLLHETHQRIECHDDDDHQRIHRPAMVALQPPGRQRHQHRHQQQADQRVLELRQQAAPGGNRGDGREAVRPVFGEAARGLGGGQALAGIDLQALCHRVGQQQRGVGKGKVQGHGNGRSRSIMHPTLPAATAPAQPGAPCIARRATYSTVTLLARFRGLSTSVPRAQAVW